MGKKQKAKQPSAPPPPAAAAAQTAVGNEESGPQAHDAQPSPDDTPQTPNPDGAASASPPARPRSRARRLLPDIIKAAVAVGVIGLGIAIWLKPPLVRDTFPYVSYTLGGQTFTNAVLYRPLAMPTRFYVGLPEKVADRYQWFTLDKRREIVALADGPPQDSFLWWPAVKRNAPLGLDLEFRTLDSSQWLIFFFKDAIVFSNNILSVRLDTKPQAEAADGSE